MQAKRDKLVSTLPKRHRIVRAVETEMEEDVDEFEESEIRRARSDAIDRCGGSASVREVFCLTVDTAKQVSEGV